MRHIFVFVLLLIGCARTVMPIDIRDDGDSRGGGDFRAFGDVDAAVGPSTLVRSVGAQNTLPLAAGGANVLTIWGGVAFVTESLPPNVGIGDVIQYDTSGDATPDALAFIHGRVDSQTFAVRSATGALAQDSSTTNWAIYRAYTSLADAVAGNPNSVISLAFDGWIDGPDLPAMGKSWIIALYGDAPDTTAVSLVSWITDPTHHLHIMTPLSLDQVGARQRHTGAWNDNRYTLDVAETTALYIEVAHVRVSGLQINLQANGNDSGVAISGNIAPSAEISIDANIIRADPATYTGSQNRGILVRAATFRVWNNFIYGFDFTDGRGIYAYSDAVLYAYNNIATGCAAGFSGGDFSDASITNTADDGLAPGAGSVAGSAQLAGAHDGHLSATDAVAAGAGTNLSDDGALRFTSDIDGEARDDPWDIGADQR